MGYRSGRRLLGWAVPSAVLEQRVQGGGVRLVYAAGRASEGVWPVRGAANSPGPAARPLSQGRWPLSLPLRIRGLLAWVGRRLGPLGCVAKAGQ